MKGSAGRALKLLKKAEKAAARLKGESPSAEDLHDFRVGLRRLLVHLKAYDVAAGKTRKRVGKVFHATGPLRDAQVEMSWLEDYDKRARKDGADAGTLIAQAARRRQAASLDRFFFARFTKAAKDLRKELKAAGKRAFKRKDFQREAVKAAREHARKLRRKLSRLEKDANPKTIHKARVEAKRLRYLVEPVEGKAGLPPLKSLKRLQTILGDIHDRDLIEGDLKALRAQKHSVGPLAARAISEARRQKAELLAQARKQLSLTRAIL